MKWTQENERPRLNILLSVDWEGTDLREENLERMARFKKSFDLPLLHFLNPAYYTADAPESVSQTTRKIRSVLDAKDELGLHLHPSRHLVERAGIPFQKGPTFSRRGQCSGRDEGMDVMLHAYPYQDLNKLMDFSRKLLEDRGFAPLRGFRAGGWMADGAVCECALLNGFHFDSSATSSSLLKGSFWEGDNLGRYINILWPDINLSSQSYYLETSFGPMLELPNNLGAIDYWTEEGVHFFAGSSINEAKAAGEYTAVVNSHQETAVSHWDKLDKFVEILYEQCSTQGIDLQFISQAHEEGLPRMPSSSGEPHVPASVRA